MKNVVLLEKVSTQELNELIEKKINSSMDWLLIELKKDRSLISRKRACKMLNVSIPTIAKMTKEGRIEGYRLNGEVKYKLCDLEGYIKSCSMIFEEFNNDDSSF